MSNSRPATEPLASLPCEELVVGSRGGLGEISLELVVDEHHHLRTGRHLDREIPVGSQLGDGGVVVPDGVVLTPDAHLSEVCRQLGFDLGMILEDFVLGAGVAHVVVVEVSDRVDATIPQVSSQSVEPTLVFLA